MAGALLPPPLSLSKVPVLAHNESPAHPGTDAARLGVCVCLGCRWAGSGELGLVVVSAGDAGAVGATQQALAAGLDGAICELVGGGAAAVAGGKDGGTRGEVHDLAAVEYC